jgi:hypothetical protein
LKFSSVNPKAHIFCHSGCEMSRILIMFLIAQSPSAARFATGIGAMREKTYPQSIGQLLLFSPPPYFYHEKAVFRDRF